MRRRDQQPAGRAAARAWWVALLLGGGCHRAFVCDDDSQCASGLCEADGWCSFSAEDCPSGRRYAEHASAALAGTCVVPQDVGESTTTVPSTSASTSSSTGDDDTASSSGTGDDDPCNGLTPSGPVIVTEDDQVVAGRLIVADGVDGITVEGHTGVTIRDCEIHHRGGHGIFFGNADDLTIENVIIVHDGAPDAGAHEDGNQGNIVGSDSARLRIDHVRLTRGSSGIELSSTPAAQLSFIEGHDVRGPGNGALVYLYDSDDAVLEDFSCENPLDTGRPNNLVELHQSSDTIVRRGLLDGHNAEFGYGIHFTQISGMSAGGLVEDVDTVRMTNGGFSCFQWGEGITFRRTRARENICEIVSVPIEGCKKPGDNGGCIPNSDAITWTASPGSSDIVIEASSYFDLCAVPLWPDEQDELENPPVSYGPDDLVEADFVPRAPIRIEACWE